jgi:acyl-CoA hydrolase
MNEALPGKPVSASRTELSVFMLPHHANPYGSIHGGVILMHMDSAAAMAAMRHCRANAVTVAMDYVHFLAPTHVGELVTFKASLNLVAKTSMEVGVRVEAENLITGDIRHTGSAYLTFVVMDEHFRPAPAPPLLLETDEDRRHFRQAEERRAARLGCKA